MAETNCNGHQQERERDGGQRARSRVERGGQETVGEELRECRWERALGRGEVMRYMEDTRSTQAVRGTRRNVGKCIGGINVKIRVWAVVDDGLTFSATAHVDSCSPCCDIRISSESTFSSCAFLSAVCASASDVSSFFISPSSPLDFAFEPLVLALLPLARHVCRRGVVALFHELQHTCAERVVRVVELLQGLRLLCLLRLEIEFLRGLIITLSCR